MTIPKEIPDLMPERKEHERHKDDKTWCYYCGYNQAIRNVEAVLPQMLSRIEKSYGGCKLCYGKGYATVRQEWTGRGTHIVDETPKPCSCDRGKQFTEVIALAEKRGAEMIKEWAKNEHRVSYGERAKTLEDLIQILTQPKHDQ